MFVATTVLLGILDSFATTKLKMETPPKSPKDAVANNTVADTSLLGSSGPSVGANVPAASTGVSTANMVHIPCAVQACDLSGNTRAASYSFASHPSVAAALRIFAFVELTQIRAYVFQTRILAASSTGYTPYHMRFGPAPRALPASSGTGKSAIGVVDRIPTLRSIVSSPVVGTTATFLWTPNGSADSLPFPPGVQTDLRPLETRFNYIEFFAGFTNPSDEEKSIFAIQLDFTIACRGSNFASTV